MAVIALKGRLMEALSSDAKPAMTELPLGWKLHETDSGRWYLWDGSQWNYTHTDAESESRNANQPRSSIHQLFGDSFAQQEASAVFLLEDLTDEQGGTSLTNNGTIDLTRVETKLPLRGHLVPTLNGSSQYFSIPTESKVEVGTDSFAIKVDFSTTAKGGSPFLFSYGDPTLGGQYFRGYFASDHLAFDFDDGTNNSFVQDPVVERWQDGKIHTAVFFVDRTNDITYIFCDGQLLTSVSNAAVTGTITNPGKAMQIGAGESNGVVVSYYNGDISNFQLYKNADPDKLFTSVGIVSNPLLRESAANGTFTLTFSASYRANNNWFFADNDGEYTYQVVNTSEGYYDLIDVHATDTNLGIHEVIIDGITRLTVDQYSGSVVNNVTTKTAKPFFLSAGTHLLKFLTNGQHGSSSAFITSCHFIELIKRDGKYNAEDEATSALLLGDEILQRSKGTWTQATATGDTYNNRLSNATNLDYTEGDIYLKKGHYKVTLTVREDTTNAGKIDLDIGGKEVLNQLLTNATTNHVKTTKDVFLEGGKTTVRLGTITGSGDNTIRVVSIRIEMMGGKGNGDIVRIFGTDDDVEDIGTGSFTLISTSSRFNHAIEITGLGGALNDEAIFRRYFSGGSYLVKYVYVTSLDGGIIDIGWGGTQNNIFDGFDQQNGSTVWNNEAYRIVQIPRGFHDINFLGQADGGSGDFDWHFSLLEFTKVGNDLNAQLDESQDNTEGAMVPLGRYSAKKAESTKTFNLAGVDIVDKYSKIIVQIDLQPSASLELQMTLNGIASYFQDGNSSIGGTQAAIDITQSTLRLGSTSVITAVDQTTNCDVEISAMKGTSANLRIFWHLGTVTVGDESGSGGCAANPTTLDTIVIQTSTSTWKVGTVITVYGMKK